MNADQLQQQLDYRADKKLEEAVDKAIAALAHFTWKTDCEGITVNGSGVSCDYLLRRVLRDRMIAGYRKDWREREVRDFITRVEATATELDELRANVEAIER